MWLNKRASELFDELAAKWKWDHEDKKIAALYGRRVGTAIWTIP
jgi:hypothetical protein